VVKSRSSRFCKILCWLVWLLFFLEKQALLAQTEKNKEEALYWRQRREHDLIKFEIEKETMIVTLQIKQELNE
jgi:hypothetical protein